MNNHSKATGVSLCASKTLKEPKTIDVTEMVPNKGIIGKEFKKEAKIIKALDRMQLSAIQSGDDSKELVYMRSKITDNQTIISKSLKIVVPKDITSQKAINQYFT